MAVLKMKKLRLLLLRSKREELLKELVCRGCVEFSPLEAGIKGTELEGLLKPEASALEELKASHEKLLAAIGLLDRQSPAVKRLHLRRQALEEHVLLDDTGLNFALRKAGEVLALNERMSFARSEQGRMAELVKQLQPWMDVEVPLNAENLESCAVLMGTVPAGRGIDELSNELEHIDEKSELFLIKEDKKLKYIGLLCMRSRLDEMRICLEKRGFVPAPRTDGPGSAMHCAGEAKARIQELAREEEHCKKLLSEELIHREGLRLAADRVSVKLAMAEAEALFHGTESTVVMEGWFPGEREAELLALFEKLGCAYEISEPRPEEYPDVPVLLKGRHSGQEALPCYGSTSPGPLTALFFTLFLALLTADAGLGLVVFLAALLSTVKKKEKSLSHIMSFAGIGAIGLGIARGSYFGSALEYMLSLYHLKAPYEFPGAKAALPGYWRLLLCGTAALLVCHLLLSLLTALIKRLRRGRGPLSPGSPRRWLGDLLILCRLCALSLGGLVMAAAFLRLSLMTDNAIVCTAGFSLGLVLCFVSVMLDCRHARLRLDWLGQMKLLFKEGRAFRPLRVKTRYFKLAE